MGIFTGRAHIKNMAKKEGFALVTVMTLLAVLTIISASVLTLFSGNLKQAKYQEQKTKAYYLALSGIDLGLSALLEKDAQDETLFDEFKWDSATYPDIDNDLAYKEATVSPLTDVIYVDDNTISLTVSAINTNGRREVKLHSVASVYGSNITYSLTLIIDTENPGDKRWE